jgi:hypothetical protein
LRVDQLLETIAACACDCIRLATGGVVGGLQPSRLQASCVSGVDDNARTRRLFDEAIECASFAGSAARFPGVPHDLEALAQQDQRSTTGSASATDSRLRALAYRGAHLIPEILDLAEVFGVSRTAVFTMPASTQLRPQWHERFHAIARVQRPPHRVDLCVQQPIGGEQLQRATR